MKRAFSPFRAAHLAQNNLDFLKHWRRGGQGWQSKAIWSGSWGGKLNRLRDMEIGDVDGDGFEEVVNGTHDQGVVVVLDGAFDGSPRGVVELHQEPRRYVHEIELGDLDADGHLENCGEHFGTQCLRRTARWNG